MPATYRFYSEGGSLRAIYRNITNAIPVGERMFRLMKGRTGNPMDQSVLVAIVCLGNDSRLEVEEDEQPQV